MRERSTDTLTTGVVPLIRTGSAHRRWPGNPGTGSCGRLTGLYNRTAREHWHVQEIWRDGHYTCSHFGDQFSELARRADAHQWRTSHGERQRHRLLVRDWQHLHVPERDAHRRYNVPFATKPYKAKYMWRDIERRAQMDELPVRLPIPYPLKEFDLANRVAMLGVQEGWCRDYVGATYRRWFELGQEPGIWRFLLIASWIKLFVRWPGERSITCLQAGFTRRQPADGTTQGGILFQGPAKLHTRSFPSGSLRARRVSGTDRPGDSSAWGLASLRRSLDVHRAAGDRFGTLAVNFLIPLWRSCATT